MQVTVTNLTSTNQAGSLTISITDSTGNAITNFSQSFSVDGSGSTNLEFTLPGSLPAGSYSVMGLQASMAGLSRFWPERMSCLRHR